MAEPPAAELTEPTAHDPVPDLVENIVGAGQYISPSYWINWAIQQICGVNPVQWTAEQFAGDYEAVQRAGIALKNLGEFNDVFGTAVGTAADQVRFDWQGNAADSAQAYFDTLANAVKEQVTALREVGEQFETMAVGVYEAAQGFAGFLHTAIDMAIVAGLNAAASALAAATVFGAPAAAAHAAAAAAAIVKGTSAWRSALAIHSAVWDSVQTFTGVVAGYLGGLRGMDQVPLPSGSYDHPGVGE